MIEAPEPQSAPETSLSYRLVALCAGIPSTMCYTILVPILPKMEDALAHNADERLLVKMVVSVSGLAMAIGAPLGGYLVDRLGRGTLMAWGMLVWALLGFSGYFISDLKLLIATRFVVGVVTSVVGVVGITIIGDMNNVRLRNSFMGFVTTVMAATGVVILPISGMLGDIHWRTPFFLYLGTLPMAALCWGVMRNEVRTRKATMAAPAPAPVSDKPFPWPFGIMFLAMVLGVISTVNVTYMPFALRDLGAASSTQIAATISMKSAVIATVAALYGFGRLYVSTYGALALALSLAAVGALCIGFANVYLFAAGALIVWGVGLGWFSPTLAARSTEGATTETRGRFVGLVRGARSCAAFSAVLIFEPILRWGGAKAVIGAVGAIAAVAALYYVLRYRPWPTPSEVKPA